eukprot:4807180-Prymnesium_polylepis.3
MRGQRLDRWAACVAPSLQARATRMPLALQAPTHDNTCVCWQLRIEGNRGSDASWNGLTT